MTGAGMALTGNRQLGNYELLRLLAHGGMADIFLARRRGAPASERPVAVKLLRDPDPESCAMFLDEARLVAMLDHPNIAQVLEIGAASGSHYLAMEYVHGADLRAVLAAAQRAERAVPLETAIAIVSAAAAGLDHAHRRCGPDGAPLCLVHRDVSLSNIMAGYDGAVKVVDFGIASTTIASVHTSPGMVRGKASYMSPEQCLGELVDQRADVFGLGVVLYELTTGERCFAGATDFDRMLAVVRGDYRTPSRVVAGYPHVLEEIVHTALAVSPIRRFRSTQAMARALEHVAVEQGWVGGPGAIARLMRRLFASYGDSPERFGEPTAPAEPALSLFGDAPVTEQEPIVAGPAPVAPSGPPRRFARASAGGDDDVPTRGRGRLRRPAWLAG